MMESVDMPQSDDAQIDPWFDALARFSSLGVLMINPEQTIDFASERARHLLGCESGDEITRCLEPVREKLDQSIKELRESVDPRDPECGADRGSPVDPVHHEVSLGENSRHLTLEVFPIHVEHCQGTLVLLRDQTEQTNLAQDLKLASRFRNLGDLYQAMAHDLRTPVASMSMYLHLLRSSLDKQKTAHADTTEKQTEYLDILSSEVKELDESLQMLLTELMPERGEAKPFDVRDMLMDAIRLIEAWAEKQDIRVELDLEEGDMQVVGQRGRVKHALLNVMMNSIDAMPDGGTLAVGLKTEQAGRCATDPPASSATRARCAAVTIADTGSGITHPEHIFDRHFTTKPGGNGVGLHVARDVVRRLGGDVTFQTRRHQGTTFRITLPLTS